MALIRSLLHMAWLVLTVIPWTCAVLLVSLLGSPTSAWWTAVSWFRVAMWGTRVILGVKFRILGLEHLPKGQDSAAVLVAKHQSALETLLLPTLMPKPLAFVFKRELLKIPFFGWSMARLDMIHIDRESRTQAMKHVIEQGCRLLGQGSWVMMFPEGTRIERGQKGTYQTAATRLAVQAAVPVLPIAVATAACWPKDGFVKQAGVVTVSIGPAIDSVGREPKALMREAETWIEAEMQRIDPHAYPAPVNPV